VAGVLAAVALQQPCSPAPLSRGELLQCPQMRLGARVPRQRVECRDGRARRDRRGRLGGDQSQPGEKSMGHAKAWCALDGAAQQGRRVATETVEAGERLIKEARGLRSRAGKGVALLV